MAVLQFVTLYSFCMTSKSVVCAVIPWDSRAKFQLVSAFGLCFKDRACGQLDHRMCRETCGQSPGRHVAPDFYHSLAAIQIHKIDGELHADGVDSFTGYNPQTFSGREAIASQQTFSALCAPVGHLDATGEHSLAGDIRDLQLDTWFCRSTQGEAI